MLSRSTFLSTILLASMVLANPLPHLQLNKRAQVGYSDSIAGLVFQTEKVTSISATFAAPAITGPKDSTLVVSLSPSFFCKNEKKIAGAAVEFGYDAHGKRFIRFGLPAPDEHQSPHSSQKLQFDEGDKIKLSIDAASATGHVQLKNLRTGDFAGEDFKSSEVCLDGAAIDITYWSNTSLLHFGKLTLEDVMVSGPSGPYKLSDAILVDMGHKNGVRVATKVEGKSTITFTQE